jgi:hypothetical protein
MPVQPSTITKEGNLLRKRQVLAAAKLKAAAERREVADQEKFDAAMAKLEQEELQRADAIEKKKSEALARKIANEEKKKAEREAKQLAAEEKKLALAEKKKKAQEEKLALAEKKKLSQEARKKEAEAAKAALAEKKRVAQEARKREAEKMQLQEEVRHKAWEEHFQKVEKEKQQSMRDEHDKSATERIFPWKAKRSVEEAANNIQAAQFNGQQAGIKASEQNKRKVGEESSSTSRTPYKLPRKVSMFDYLKGPPPGV